MINCKQKAGEGVRTYLLRLNQLAKLCKFNRPDSIEMNRKEWVSQTFIAGLASRNTRSKILEKELLDAEAVYKLAEVVEHSTKETLQYETTRYQNLKLGMAQNESKEDLLTQEGSNAQSK